MNFINKKIIRLSILFHCIRSSKTGVGVVAEVIYLYIVFYVQVWLFLDFSI